MTPVGSIATAAVLAVLALVTSPAAANAAPTPVDNLNDVPARTSISIGESRTGNRVGTANQHEARPGLSIVKLYMADHALRHGDGSERDRALAERMIRHSDDGAADGLHAKYPEAIDATAAEFRLTSTRGAPDWGSAVTSTADTVAFLETKKSTDPDSPILTWMASAAPAAADGTTQNWGTATLPGVTGSKWGWSDFGPSSVASASFGPDFSVAAQTYGSAADQTADVTNAFGTDPAAPAPSLPRLPFDDKDSPMLLPIG
ncbi:hypothetical protein ACWFRB_10790 [Rhodococcus sp. NPDC055112]